MPNTYPFWSSIKAITLSAAIASTSMVQAFDVDAGDYTALPEGTNLLAVYAQFTGRDGLYSNNTQVSGDYSLDSQVGILRGVHYTKIGDYIVDPQFLLPFGKLEAKGDLSGLGDTDGLGDLILGATVWLVNNPQEKEYFGVTPFLFLPTGDYDNQDALNLGENRYKLTMQAGYIKGLSDNVTLDLIGDVTLYGDNDDFGPTSDNLEQELSYQIQAYIRYNISPALDIRAGLSKSWIGETSVNGIDNDDEADVSKYQIGAGWFITPTTQLLATYGDDISVDNGFKEDARLNLRLLTLF
ncbi:transporter [uncultured Amphritea sp.]|uniref:transporter n=1 Tax=uncultured Amphritea sp. TaxID=981605 RepID=UPI00262A4E30|nr:transporter [uncultured Amphritea sp.]